MVWVVLDEKNQETQGNIMVWLVFDKKKTANTSFNVFDRKCTGNTRK